MVFVLYQSSDLAMKLTYSHRILSASLCLFSMVSIAPLVAILPASAQSGSQGDSMQPSPMQGGSMQNGTMQPSPMQPSPMEGGNRSSSLNAADRQFMVKAAQSDMTEIQTSQLALKRSQNSQVRQFAQEMIQQHTQSSNKLKPLAARKGVTLPKTLGAENQALLTQLTKLSGTQFDQAYMKGQTQAHTKTQATYQTVLQQGQDPEVKAFASQVLPVVTAHLRMAQNMVAGR
jgi:putative membrane protein